MATVVNAVGFGLCVAGIGLLVFRNRVVTRESDLESQQALLEERFMGRYWLDLGVGSLVVGFLFQIVAAIL